MIKSNCVRILRVNESHTNSKIIVEDYVNKSQCTSCFIVVRDVISGTP